MEVKIEKFYKRSKLKNERSIFVLLGNKSLYKVPVLYKFVAREKSIPVSWISNHSSDLRNIGWATKESDSDHSKNDESNLPQVTHISFSNIKISSLQPCRFAVVQDMQSIRPSDLLNIIESVYGKGVIIFIFSEISEINKLTSPKVCSFVESRFMKRLFSSFTSCPNCLILDDELDILFAPKTGSDHKDMIEEMNVQALSEFSLNDDDGHFELLNKLTTICSTKDQTNFLIQCLDTLKRRTVHCTISALSPRGRGKSIVLGLAIAGAIVLKYSNIFISSLNYDNVKVVFKYLLIGLDAVEYKEDKDYDLIQSVNPKFNNALIGLNIFRDHPQAVRFIFPSDVENKLEQAELVVIDEAAAMPLPLLKKLLGQHIVLMTSTTEGCGGSGKYLYEDIVSEIRRSPSLKIQDKTVSLESLFPTSKTSSWKQINLSEPINYSGGDRVESWINSSLCLESCIAPAQGCPDPQSCRLFYVCQETLFSCEPLAEKFLQQLMSLFVCTKRNVSPDILQEVADDNDYHIFCLLPPLHGSNKGSDDILCAVLVHKEKHVPWHIVYSGVNQGGFQGCFNKWTAPTEVDADNYLPFQGIHIIDIVTYPSYRKMGYGSRALQLMQEFYEGKWISLDDTPYIYSSKDKKYENRDLQSGPPLLLQLTEVEPEKIDFIMVSYFLTPDLLRFWKKVEFVPLYISEKRNSALEHLCIMMKGVNNEISTYMKDSWRPFCEYFFVLLNNKLKCFPSELALNLISCKFSKQLPKEALKKEDIDVYLKPLRMKALEKYCQNLGDLHCIMACVPTLAKLFFRQSFIGVDLPVAQQLIFLAFGLQRKTIEDIAADLTLHTTQVHGLLNRTIRKLTTHLTNIIEKAVETTIVVRDINMEPVAQSLDDELEEAAQKIKVKQMEDLKRLKAMDFSEFAIKGSEDDWEKALHNSRRTLVSIKSLKKKPEDERASQDKKSFNKTNKKKDKKRKR